MTARTIAAASIAVVSLAGCGTPTKPSGTTRSSGPSQAVAWAGCLRSHGVPGFPDPIPGHNAQFPDSAGQLLHTRSLAVLAAERACESQAPAAALALEAPTAGQKAAFLRYARCMRAHGVPSYPDPTYGQNGRPNIPNLSSDGIDTQSPAFKNAAAACNGHGIPLS